MSEFQLGLLIIGALAIVGVIVYNRLQERRAGIAAERAFGSRHADVLMDELPARREPTLEPVSRKPEPAHGASAAALPDESLDYVIGLAVQRPLSASAFLEYWAPLEHRFARSVLAAGSEDGRSWTRIAHGEPGAYNSYQAALQLVSRAGVVSDGELVEFRSQVDNLAAMIGATVNAPEVRRAMERARELDQFCADADIQIALNLVAAGGGPLAARKLQAAMAAAGLERGPDGSFSLRDAGGDLVFLASPAGGEGGEESAKLAFFLDVPRVRDVDKAYESMARLARQLAAELDGVLVDDNGRVLDEQALSVIGAELEAVRQALEGRGLPPGSPSALRLFA